MDVVERLVDLIMADDVPLEREAVERAAAVLAKVEAPLADAGLPQRVADVLVGMGPIERILRDPSVTDVLVNGPREVWVERNGILERSDVVFRSDEDVVAAVERVIGPLGLRLDAASPMVDGRIPDGSRVHAVLPPIAVDGPLVAVRRFTRAVGSLDELVDQGGATAGQADVLQEAVTERRNIVVSGGTGVGKTTLLNVLAALVPPSERVVTIEDAAELQLAGHVVRLEARRDNAEGVGEVPLELLLRSALRLRPDRIIVGEVRGPEALDLIQAMNTGHSGSMSTVHANGPEDALWRIETLALSGSRRATPEAMARQLRSAIDLIVHMERAGSQRRVAQIAAVTQSGCQEVAA